ncbi:hypothetical protein [Paraburkholderia sp. J41]|uniref:hypothetical protein n=1 Tax=Paraburkholderia sp. J41 TaxID=2805433 RepID=UPI002AC34B98|nr:hypothetical protein [Paraburkholderia sp. J41]
MSEETFPIDFGNTADDWITSPLGRNLNLVCKKNTTLYTDETVKEVLVPERYVKLKITTNTSGFTIQKVYGHPNVGTRWEKSTEPQPAVVVPTYHARLILFDSSKGEDASVQYDINVTRDAWYYLGVDTNHATQCRNIAFEPADAAKNKYLTDQIHFPTAADPIIHGYFLMEDESQRQQEKRYLHAEKVSIDNPFGPPVSSRNDESFATNVMFHIGGFYIARASALHAKWLGGSEGCFAFIPKKNIRATPEDAAKIIMERAFFSNKTWVKLTTMIEKYRDNDVKKRFIIEVEKRPPYPRNAVKKILMVSGALDDLILPMDGIETRVY